MTARTDDEGAPVTDAPHDGGPGPKATSQVLLVGLVLCALCAVIAAVVARAKSPDEDAAMLFRYAVNLANGHGIVFNTGGPSVDGATDMLTMFMVAGFVKIGLGVEAAMALLNGLAMVATTALLFRYAAVTKKLPLWVSALVPLIVMTGSSLFYLQHGYASPVFGFFILVLWLCVERSRLAPESMAAYAAVGGAGLLAGLVRPEGFLFAGFGLLSLLVTNRWAAWRGIVLGGLVLAAGGAVFVAWRWHVFGYPLPNPYYVKGDGGIHTKAVLYSGYRTVRMALPAIALLAIALFVRPVRRLAVAELIGVGGTALMWIALDDTTNLEGRFQFPTAIVAFVAALTVFEPTWAWLRSPRFALRLPRTALTWGLGGSVAVVLLLQLAVMGSRVTEADHPTQADIAAALRPYPGPGRLVATTEAGLVPLWTGWEALDTYGLNDIDVAHAGGIDQARLEEEQPDVIVIHGPYSEDPSAWSTMVRTLAAYARDQGYTPATVLPEGVAEDEDWDWAIYVRPDAPQHDELVASLSASLKG